MFFAPSSSLENQGKRFLEQVKTLDFVSGFHWSAQEFSQTLPRYTQLTQYEYCEHTVIKIYT